MDAPTDPRGHDALALRWLLGQTTDRVLFDSDLATALGWSAAETQAALGRLEQAGCVGTRVFIQPGGHRSLGDLRLTPAGRARVARTPPRAKRHGLFHRAAA